MLKINNNFKKGVGWSLVILAIFGLFSYSTFIPQQTFAADIVDPNEHRSLSQIDTMQEMSQQICINSREEETKQLEDTRLGNKLYWVTKLKDGNCWMTQNLDFDIPATVSNSSTNVLGPSVTTNAHKITSIIDWSDTSATYNVYFDPENYVYDGPSDSHSEGEHCTTSSSLEDCRQFSQITENSDLHYHVGNYYSYSAITVGTMDNKTGDATQSICPRGWGLPLYDSAKNGSIAFLLNLYGISGNNLSAVVDGRNVAIYNAPLYMVYSGTLVNKKIDVAGGHGFLWTASTNNLIAASNLMFFDKIDWNEGGARYRGFPVRCLATGGWLDSYPDPIEPSDNQANIAIQVSPVINLDVTKSANDMAVDFNSIDTSTIDINVSSNQKYQVTLTTEQPNLAPQKPDNAEYSIKMVGTGGGIVEKGKNGWGIKKKLSATNDNQLGSLVDESTYSPIGTNNDQIIFYRSAGPEALTNQTEPKNPLQLEVGVTVDQSLPSDTYSTMVTVTAMAY